MNDQDAGRFFIIEDCDNWEDRWEITDREWDTRWLELTAFYYTDRKSIAEKLKLLLEQRQDQKLRRERSRLLRADFKIVDATNIDGVVEQNGKRVVDNYFRLAVTQKESSRGSIFRIRWLLKEEKRIRKIMGLPKRPVITEQLPEISHIVQERLWKYFYIVYRSMQSGTNQSVMKFVRDLEPLLEKSVSESTVSRDFNNLKNHGYVEFSRNQPVTLTVYGLTEFRQLLLNEAIIKEMAELKIIIAPEDIDKALKRLALQVSENAKSPN